MAGMERECPDGRHDGKSPGRPQLPNTEQEKVIEGGLGGTLQDSGFERGSWNTGVVAGGILDGFGVPYSDRPAHRPGFSIRKPPIRPVQQRHARRAEGVDRKWRVTAARWWVEDRAVVAVDAATLRDSPASRRRIRRRGGREAWPINHPRQPTQMIGASGDGFLHLQFRGGLPVEDGVGTA